MKRTLFLIGCGYLTAASAWADLDFKTKHVVYEAKPEDMQFEAVFSFKNTGKYPVNVTKVDSNCGCISAKSDKDRYEKGEAGTVTAVFKIGSAEGVKTKNVSIIYKEDKPVVKPKVIAPSPSDSSDPLAFIEQPKVEPVQPVPSLPQTDRLTVELRIPTVVQVDPKITKWDVGAATETKTIQITMDHEDPIKIKDVRSSRDNIRVETKEIEAGKRYEILVTPQTTESVQLGMLTIETDSEIKKHRKKLAFYSIQRPEAAKRAQDVPDQPAPPAEEIIPEAVDSTSKGSSESDQASL